MKKKVFVAFIGSFFPFGEQLLKCAFVGCLGGSVIERLPLAQVVIPESRDWVLYQAAHREAASPSACVSATLCVSHE